MMKQIAGAVCGAIVASFIFIGVLSFAVQALLWWYGQ